MDLQRITIYGTGLIGGSLALALKRAFPGVRITGVDKPEVLQRALQLGIIDTTEREPAEVTVLATPVGEILRLMDDLADGKTIVTDVGSTKMDICAKAERAKVAFIGGHPMAGLEQSGPEAATAL